LRAGPTRTQLLPTPVEPIEETDHAAPDPVTISVASVLRTKLPLVAVIVSVYLPWGVSGELLVVNIDVAGGVRDCGAKEPVAPVGSPDTERDIGFANPLIEVSVTLQVVLSPSATFWVDGSTLIEKSGLLLTIRVFDQMPAWDPNLYLKYANERARPAADLIAQIRLESPAHIADLGCGPGNST